MAITSPVRRLPSDTFIVLRASYVKVCNGNVTAAALISFFEYWHTYILDKHRQGPKTEPPNLWQHHTTKALEKGILGLGKRHSIDIAKTQLAGLGIVEIGRNPDYKFAFDATLHYQFCPEILNNLLALVENSAREPFVEIDVAGYAENGEAEEVEISAAISEDPLKDQKKDIPAAGGGPPPKSEPVKKKIKVKKMPAGPDIEWQRWVDAWFEFYKNLHAGMPPMINDVQLSALKKLRAYLCTVAKKVDGQTLDDAGFGCWEFVLANWHKLDDWQRGEFDLTVVFKKISNILSTIKNGSSKNINTNGGSGKPGTSEARVDAIKNY